MDYLSYTGIEEVKNGCFFSQKYESAMVVMPYPTIIVFANEEPCYGKMSQDRWRVQQIGGGFKKHVSCRRGSRCARSLSSHVFENHISQELEVSEALAHRG